MEHTATPIVRIGRDFDMARSQWDIHGFDADGKYVAKVGSVFYGEHANDIIRSFNAHQALVEALEGMLGQYIAFVSQGAATIHHQGDREAYLAQHGALTAAAHAALKQARGDEATS